MPESLDDLLARRSALDARGIAEVDAPGLHFVDRLLERANALGGGAAERLRARASARLDRLEGRIEAGSGHGSVPRTVSSARVQSERVRRRMIDRARARGLHVLEEGSDAVTVGARLYARRGSDVRARAAVADAFAAVPDGAGHYHGAAVAANTLEGLRALGGGYLPAQLERLEALALLEAFIAAERARKP
jgi:hypothetical protein